MKRVSRPGPPAAATIGYEDLRAGTVRQVAQLMAAAAITAPKSGGQLFLAGKPNFMETVIADDAATRRELAAWMRARGKERRERIWFRLPFLLAGIIKTGYDIALWSWFRTVPLPGPGRAGSARAPPDRGPAGEPGSDLHQAGPGRRRDRQW